MGVGEGAIADLLVESSEQAQLIVTTHSEALVSSLPPESVLVCERDYLGTHTKSARTAPFLFPVVETFAAAHHARLTLSCANANRRNVSTRFCELLKKGIRNPALVSSASS
jgi:hypothetical protein